MNILVTGGAGYIGSHVCKVLARAGHIPIVYDNLINGHERAVKWGPLEVGDIADRPSLDAVINKYQPDSVMHFAAYAYVGESVEDPGKYYRNNVAGTITLLEAMRDNKIKKIVFSSSCATYGLPQTELISESHPQKPINPYGMSKLMIEQILKDFDHAHDLRSVSLRYFNAAGADIDGEIGEMHDPETHLVPLVFDTIINDGPKLTIFGDDYNTTDGTCIRDYIHVEDLAIAHLLALNFLNEGGETRAYNLGNGNGFSVKEVIKVIEKVTNKKVQYEIGPRRSGDPDILVGDAYLINQELGWLPKIKDLEQIVQTAWLWHKKINHLDY